jgi:TIGR03009 family protein
MNRGGWIVLAATAWFVESAGVSVAQDPPPPKKAPRAAAADGLLNNEVDDLLQKWHQRTRKVTTLYAEFTRSVTDMAFRKTRTNKGQARFRDPNLARLDILKDEKGLGREVFILSNQPRPGGGRGLDLRHYVAEGSKLQIHEFPDDAVRNAQEEGPLRLLFGIKPENAHARYSFEILEKPTGAIKVKITPKLEADRQEFLYAVLTLDTETFMPRDLRVRENADTEAAYAFTAISTNVDTPTLEIDLSLFDPLPIDETKWKTARQRIAADRPKAAGGSTAVQR